MKWPWTSKPEVRSASYTDMVLHAAVSTAEGSAYVGDSRHTAALEAVCRLYQSVFCVASVSSSNSAVSQAITSTWLSSVLRAMILDGQYLCEVASDSGRLAFLPASQVDVEGGPVPSTWRYNLSLDGPTGSITRRVDAEDVLHLRWSCDPGRNWVGIGPMQAARMTSRLAGALETRQAEEAAAPVGAILPMARGPVDPDDEADPLGQLRDDLRNIGGRTILTESQMATGDRATAPQADFAMRRLGGNIPVGMTELRTQAGLDVAKACGVPLSLIERLSTGTGAREGWRRFTTTSAMAVGAIIADEIQQKLNVSCEFDLSAAYGSDLVGRSTAFAKLVSAGMDVTEARGIAGL